LDLHQFVRNASLAAIFNWTAAASMPSFSRAWLLKVNVGKCCSYS
uniref:Uncharacterized protein n=1 Tax=Triticum urartu TaxID=4572 RepID=A0A8R7UAR7_TRIUA